METPVCLVGHRRLFRAGLKQLLDCEGFKVVLEADGVSELQDVSWDSGIFIFDFPNKDVEADLRLIKGRFPDCHLVVIAEVMKTEELALSFSAGADGYLLAEISPEALRESLQLVSLGEKVFPSRLVSLLCGENPMPRPMVNGNALSDREVAIVSRLAVGLPNKVIANELTITEATVKVHLKSILRKLGVANRTQAAIWAVNNGMAAAPTYVQ